MSRLNSTRPPISAWQTALLRLTAFPSPTSAQFDAEKWWSEIVGETPEKTTSQPKIMLQAAEGLYGAGKLVLNVQPIRIDLLYAALDDNNIEASIPSIGSFLDAT